MKLYIAGPMSGLPEFNYPEFHRVARNLRRSGFEVLSPAENDFPTGTSWETYMKDGINKMMQADGVAMLGGWNKSRGATVEYNLALELGLPVAYYLDWAYWGETLPKMWIFTDPVKVPLIP